MGWRSRLAPAVLRALIGRAQSFRGLERVQQCLGYGQIGHAVASCKMLFWFWRRFWMYASPFPVTKVRV